MLGVGVPERSFGSVSVRTRGRFAELRKRPYALEPVESLAKGQRGGVVLDVTPFYVESGGQVSDEGVITAANGRALVVDVSKKFSKSRVHLVEVEEGTIAVGDTVTATVDVTRRDATRRNHTATHLLHAALVGEDTVRRASAEANAAPAHGFKLLGLNHLSYQCPDYTKARDFYASTFGMEVTNDKGNGRVLAVGAEAKRMVGRTPGNIVAIRPMKDGVIADFDSTEKMLAHFIKKAHNRTMWVRPRIVIGVPSEITQVEKRAVIDSAYRAKASEVHLVEQAMVAAIGAVANIAGQLGDLAESAFKRGAGVKDSGTMLPGHGGWLDRVDSSLFSVPAVYAVLLLRQL